MQIPAKIEQVVTPILKRHGCDLVLGTFRRERAGWVLRLLIERHGADPNSGSGVDHRLCMSISREVGTTLEVEETIAQSYTLEVSSPGIERPLVRPEDFKRFTGRRVSAKVRQSINGQRRFKGTLGGITDGEILLDLGEGKTVNIPVETIEKANLVYDPRADLAATGD